MAVIDLDLGHYGAARDRLIPLVGGTDSPDERAASCACSRMYM